MLVTNIRLDYNTNGWREWTISAIDTSDNPYLTLSDMLGKDVTFTIHDHVTPQTPWPRSSNVPVIYNHRNLYDINDYNKLMHTTDLSIDEDSFLEKKEVKEEPKRVVDNAIEEVEV